MPTREGLEPDEADERPASKQDRTSMASEPALRAALLALGLGLVWIAFSARRRRRPTDVW